jgi:hypothetical protein
MGLPHRLELLVIVGHSVLQGKARIIEVPTHLRAQWGALGLFGLELTHDRHAKLTHALGQDHARLAQEPADLTDSCCSGLDQPLPHPMEGLEVLLAHPCDRHDTHRRPRDGLTDGFGIAGSVRGRLARGVHAWGGEQPPLMTMRTKPPRPVVGTPTGFHAHEGRRPHRDSGQPRTTGHPLPEDRLSAVIHADEVKHQRREIDAEYTDLLGYGIRLLSVYGGPRYCIHAGALKPHRKGAGPLH